VILPEMSPTRIEGLDRWEAEFEVEERLMVVVEPPATFGSFELTFNRG